MCATVLARECWVFVSTTLAGHVSYTDETRRRRTKHFTLCLDLLSPDGSSFSFPLREITEAGVNHSFVLFSVFLAALLSANQVPALRNATACAGV